MKELLKNEFFHGFLRRFFVFTLKKVDPEKKFVMISGKAAPSSCFCENACAEGSRDVNKRLRRPNRRSDCRLAGFPSRIERRGARVAGVP